MVSTAPDGHLRTFAILAPMDTFFIFSAKYLIVLPVLILGGYFLLQRSSAQRRMALFALASGVLTYAVALVAGHFYYDPRPFVVGNFIPLVSHAADNGFPSDHTLLASVFAVVGLYWNRALGLVLCAIAVLIAIARVYVGVHHPIDVVGSIVIATVATTVVYVFLNYVSPKATA